MKTVSSEKSRANAATRGQARPGSATHGQILQSRNLAKKRAEDALVSLHDPTVWPLRMRRPEVSRVLRISERELRRRVLSGRFPKADDGVTWDRELVQRYAQGGIKQLERAAEQHERRDRIQMVRAK